MTRPHHLGHKVKGHPLLWLAVLSVSAAAAFWYAFDEVTLASRVARDFGKGPAVQLVLWAGAKIIVGFVLVYQAARVARLCWKIYAGGPPAAPGHCRHCGYDLRATPGRCPECGATPATATA